MGSNPLHQAIYEKIVAPELQRMTRDVDGVIVSVDYYEQRASVMWRNWMLNHDVVSRGLPIPQEANGVHAEALKSGDRVRIGFRNADIARPYISMIYKDNASPANYYSSRGSGIPKGIGYI